LALTIRGIASRRLKFFRVALDDQEAAQQFETVVSKRVMHLRNGEEDIDGFCLLPGLIPSPA
jgi:hypothetical protein